MRIITLFILVCFAYMPTQAQVYLEIIDKNYTLPFEQIVQKVENYYAGKDKGRGSGYKQFKRWAFFNADRLTVDGYLQNIASRELDELVTYRQYKALTPELNFSCNWETVGGTAYERIASGHNGGLGRVNTIIQDPDDANTMYVGTPAGGLWKTTSGGGWNPASPATSYWEPLTDGLPLLGVSGIAIDPTSPMGNRTLYILTGDGDGGHNTSIGVLKSFDGGDTWFETDFNQDRTTGLRAYKLLMHPTDPNTLFAVTNAGIHRTTDGGVNWTIVQGGLFFDIEFRPGTPDTMYASSATQVFRSINGGVNWTPVSAAGCTITNAGLRLELAVTPADPDYLYVLSGGVPLDFNGDRIAGMFNGVYLSTDSGVCFSLQANQPNILGYASDGSDARHQGGYDLAIAVSPTDENEVHIGGINCWKSTNAGVDWAVTTTWTENTAAAGDYTHPDIHYLGFWGSDLYCGSDGGIAVSTNNAGDWSLISQGLRITQFYRIGAFSDGDDYVMGGAQDNGLNQLVDMGAGFGNLQHWEGADGFEVSPDVANDYVFGATQNGCLFRFEYPNGSFTGLSVFPGQSDSCGGAWLTPHLYDAANGALLAGYQDVWRSTDSGSNFNNISNGNIGTGMVDHLVVAASDTDVIYVSKNTTLYRTINDGGAWADITSDLPLSQFRGITYFAVDPTDADRIWVTVAGFGAGEKVFFRDIGTDATWTNITGSLPNLPVNCIVYETGSADGLYIGTDVGVYYRDNNIGDWVLYSNALPNVIVTELEINYTTNKLYAGTFGRGVWSSELISNCSGICLACPVFDNFHSQPNTYSSEDCIVSTAVVYNSTDITYEAENYIHLQNDFYVKSPQNATFHALIKACSPVTTKALSIANVRALSGFYVGMLPEKHQLNVPNTADSFTASNDLQVHTYPNPTSDQLNLELMIKEAQPLVVKLYNVQGYLLQTFEKGQMVDEGRFINQYSIKDLPNGTYILEIVLKGKSTQIPIIKTK